ncbi:MAG: RES domain-containing protein [Bacteroidetes bacterium]|nr:MAG: RES domain-containing protein [Bacteroidota bacterium]
MKVYRLAKRAFRDDLTGSGAEKYGGRWNNIGTSMLYTCEHRSLAVLEVAVHIQLDIMPRDYYMLEIVVPDDPDLILNARNRLPDDWERFPYGQSSQSFGDDFIKANKFLMAKVPSAIVNQEHNYLINPFHKLAREIKITNSIPFVFDYRLVK